MIKTLIQLIAELYAIGLSTDQVMEGEIIINEGNEWTTSSIKSVEFSTEKNIIFINTKTR